jgi:hypothetical protein
VSADRLGIRWFAAAVTVLCGVAVVTARVDAASILKGPSIDLSRSKVSLDERISVTIANFEASAVTISLCGNDGLRGSADCNNEFSKGVRLNGDGTATMVQFGVATPPTPCPCIVRVFSANNDEVATAPITITDHATADTVAPPGGVALDESLGVVLDVDEADMGLGGNLRYSLGGRGTFDVTASVKNRSNAILTGLRVVGTVGRGGDDQIATIDFALVEPLQPGTTWEQTVQVEIPSPSFGELQWVLTVARGGKSLEVPTTTDHSPLLLLALAIVLVLDIALVFLRVLTSRRAQREADADAEDAAASAAAREQPIEVELVDV